MISVPTTQPHHPTEGPDASKCFYCESTPADKILPYFEKNIPVCAVCYHAHIRFDRERKAELLREFLDTRHRDLLRRGLIRENFRSAGFEKSDPRIERINPESWKAGKEWHGEENLYIHGPVGTGKSFLALSALRRFFIDSMGKTVAEVSARRFTKTCDLFREGDGLLVEWKKADLLLIDDMDKAQWNSERLTALWELLDCRMVSGKRIIITSNISPLRLVEMLEKQTKDNVSIASAAMDRLKPCQKIELKGGTLRK